MLGLAVTTLPVESLRPMVGDQVYELAPDAINAVAEPSQRIGVC